MTSSNHRNLPVAIVGLAAQLPSGEHSEENLDRHTFWKFLLDKRGAYEKLPQDRVEQLSGNMPPGGGTFLKGATKFDNVEFGSSTKDALSMTASTRRLIELGFLALLDSGIDSRGKKLGTFTAGTNAEFFDGDDIGPRGFGSTQNTLANRVAYTLNVTGPSLCLDTACSSTLTAMHLAIRSMESGDCDAAIVAGCQYNMNLWDWITYTEGGILTPDTKCKPFDATANGFIKGEGAGAVVIKPLDAAIADNDYIYAVVLGSSINSNGARAPLHAPSGVAQQECIRAAFAQAGRDPKDVDFVELHATGTAVGDPIEVNAAGELFARSDDVVVGSVKGNLGHLEISAFLTSLLKMCLILENKIIPPNVNFNTPNPKIMWNKYHLKVPTEPMPLGCRSSSGKSLVSIASSGIGGSNGHVVLESPPDIDPPASLLLPDMPVLFVVGGLSPRAAQEISSSVLELLSKNTSKEALSQAVTHARRARQLPWRTYFVHTPVSSSALQVRNPVLIPKERPPIVFVFTGQGPQHIGMGRSLFAAHRVFRESILEMDKIYEKFTGVSLIQNTGLFDSKQPSTLSGVWSVDIINPAMAMVQIALFDLFISVGVKPDVLVGHSSGEIPMIYASGAGSKAMAVEIAIARGRAMSITEPFGAGMAAIACNVDRANLLINKVKDELDGVLAIACYNSPDAVVVSGSNVLLDRVIALAQADNIFARKIQTLTPSHTVLMEASRTEYEAGMKDIFARCRGSHKPTLLSYSTVSGHGKLIGEFTPEYLWTNVRQPVHFHQTISSILQDFPTAAFVEVSPHPTLSSYIAALGVPSTPVICPMRRPAKKASGSQLDLIAFAESLGFLATLGINSIDLTPLYGRASRDPAFDIRYPFTTRHFPLRIDGPRDQATTDGAACSARLKMNAKTFPDLAEHVINGEPIVPAAGFIDIVLQTGAKILWDIEFKSILSLASESPVDTRLVHDGSKWTLKTLRKALDGRNSTDVRVHSTGFSSVSSSSPPAKFDIPAILARLTPLKFDNFYESLKPMAEFGPTFQRLSGLSGNHTEALAEIRTQSTHESSMKYVFHPVILDACLHWALHPAILQNLEADVSFLPAVVRKFTLYGTPQPNESIYSHFLLRDWTPDTRVADFTICDSTGTVLCKIKGLELRRVSSASHAVRVRYDLWLQPVLNSAPLPRCETGWSREERELHTAVQVILDHLALDLTRKSLEGGVTVGGEIHRQRYFDTSKAAIQRWLPPMPSPSVVKEAQARWPHCFEIINRIGLIHKDVFRSSAPAVQALYSDGILNSYYSADGGFFGPVCRQATRMFDDNISSLYRQGKRVIRVLEVGAGTGLLTRYLCDALKQRKEEDLIVEYVVSDISWALASSTASSTVYKYSSAKRYDLSQPPEAQGITPGSFDIVTGLHVLHAVPDVGPALSSILRVLGGGGSALIVELNGASWKEGRPGTLWLDFVFGGFAEWFGYSDGRDHCTLSPEQWKLSLVKEGFEDIQISTEDGGGIEFVFTAQKSPFLPSSPQLDVPSPIFLTYKFGEEMALQQEISRLDVNQSLSLWLLSKGGSDGDAGIGLSQSLCREFTSWDIHLAIFEGVDHEADRVKMVLQHGEYLNNDTIVRFSKDGVPHVHKAVPSPSPLPPVLGNLGDFDPCDVWVDAGPGVVQPRIALLKEYEMSINVSAFSSSSSSWRGFVGTIVESKSKRISPGSVVIGVAETQISKQIVCHSGQVGLVSVELINDRLAEYALPMIIAATALGSSRLSGVDTTLPPLRILIAAEDEISQSLYAFLSLLPKLALVEMANASDDAQFDIIIADSATVGALPEVAFWRGKLFVWDKIIREGHEIDPWSIGFLLTSALRLADPAQLPREPRLTYPRERVQNASVPTGRSLFDANKSYILLGGASDMGTHIALWMYQNGARYIVLTSRRGKSFFDTNEFIPTKQKLTYMNTRDDLCLRIEACDALSLKATSSLIQSINRPLGGCFLMTLVLADKLFMHQTAESFRKVCDARVTALEIFEKASPIKNLDFFVFFSSIVAALGNVGQANYAAANTAVEGYLAKYPNAFSIAIPGISNIGYLARVSVAADGDAYKRIDRSSCAPEDLCAWLEDGLLKLSRGNRAARYIPDVKWNMIEEDPGLSQTTKHLASHHEEQDTGKTEERPSIIQTILGLLDVSMSDFSPDVPFTAYGLDSLGATRISEAIRSYANVSQMQLLGGMTWKQLEERINVTKTTKDEGAPQALSTEPMLQMVAKYCKDFGIHAPSAPAPVGDVVMVTGTTGSIGASVLSELIGSPAVHRVYAVNRCAADGENLMDRQKYALNSRGLDPSIADSSKVVLLEADLALPDLGLGPELLHQIRSSLTHIIHISWMVNWTLGLNDFESNIRGVRHLIDISLSSPLPSPPRLVFVSSVSAIQNYAQSSEAMSERFVEPELAVGPGYGESKWVAERLLELVASETPLRPLVVRMGQVCGGENGMWNTHEWIPGIVQSATSVRCLPAMEPCVSWLPLDIAATTLVDARNSTKPLLHLAHPRPVPWNTLFKHIAASLDVPLVSWSQWLARLESELLSGDKNSKRDDLRSLRLIEFYRQVPVRSEPEAEAVAPKMSNEVAVREIPSLATARQLSTLDVDKWLFYWRSIGFISF